MLGFGVPGVCRASGEAVPARGGGWACHGHEAGVSAPTPSLPAAGCRGGAETLCSDPEAPTEGAQPLEDRDPAPPGLLREGRCSRPAPGLSAPILPAGGDAAWAPLGPACGHPPSSSRAASVSSESAQLCSRGGKPGACSALMAESTTPGTRVWLANRAQPRSRAAAFPLPPFQPNALCKGHQDRLLRVGGGRRSEKEASCLKGSKDFKMGTAEP